MAEFEEMEKLENEYKERERKQQRTFIAAIICSGLCSNIGDVAIGEPFANQVAKESVLITDALLAELEK